MVKCGRPSPDGCIYISFHFFLLVKESVFSVIHIDVMTGGVWKALAELDDPELRKLAASLPGMVTHSRADSTALKHIRAFQRWQAWAELCQEVAVYPVQDVHFALYL